MVLKSVMTGSELCFTVSSLDEVDATVVYEFFSGIYILI